MPLSAPAMESPDKIDYALLTQPNVGKVFSPESMTMVQQDFGPGGERKKEDEEREEVVLENESLISSANLLEANAGTFFPGQAPVCFTPTNFVRHPAITTSAPDTGRCASIWMASFAAVLSLVSFLLICWNNIHCGKKLNSNEEFDNKTLECGGYIMGLIYVHTVLTFFNFIFQLASALSGYSATQWVGFVIFYGGFMFIYLYFCYYDEHIKNEQMWFAILDFFSLIMQLIVLFFFGAWE